MSFTQVFFNYNFQWMNLAWQFESCVAVCSRTQFLSMAIPSTYILQGRVAMHLRCAGIFNTIFSNHFTVNLLLTQPVKEFLKSVKI